MNESFIVALYNTQAVYRQNDTEYEAVYRSNHSTKTRQGGITFFSLTCLSMSMHTPTILSRDV